MNRSEKFRILLIAILLSVVIVLAAVNYLVIKDRDLYKMMFKKELLKDTEYIYSCGCCGREFMTNNVTKYKLAECLEGWVIKEEIGVWSEVSE